MNLRANPRTTCKHLGCNDSVQARGMCNTHYQQWRRTSPQCLVKESTEEMILQAMPGTRREIEQRTGFVQHTVLKHIKRLRNEDRAYIVGKKEPEPGEPKWVPIYAAGKGADFVVTEDIRRKRSNEQQNKRNRIAARRRRMFAEDIERAGPGLMFADPFNLARRNLGA